MCFHEYAHCKYCRHTVYQMTDCRWYRTEWSKVLIGVSTATEKGIREACPTRANAIYCFRLGECPRYKECLSWHLSQQSWFPNGRQDDMAWAYENPRVIPGEELPRTSRLVEGDP
ncbi:hypothetical protein TrVFT333_003186 [Trichoderma virens FT-333]|nr:hypothetical protein TrVFT333_003186 [Trichoderma virens FT-333]